MEKGLIKIYKKELVRNCFLKNIHVYISGEDMQLFSNDVNGVDLVTNNDLNVFGNFFS